MTIIMGYCLLVGKGAEVDDKILNEADNKEMVESLKPL